MPPRQKTTFKKGQKKGTTTYKDYNPAQEKANAQLERFIRDNPAGDKRNTEAPGIESILQDMPEKRAAFVRRNTRKDGTLNSAALAILNPYLDERPEYARQMNRLRTSSPEMMQAYAKRFPVENFAMEVAPRFLPVVGPLFTADQGMKANRRKQEILNTPVNRPDGGFKNFVDFFAQGMTPEQRKNTEVISGEGLRLAPQDIFNKSQPMTKEQEAIAMPEVNIFDPEKTAIDAALPTGDIVYNPVAADKQSKLDFINQVFGTDFGGNVDTPQDPVIDQLFEKAKQEQGGIIREEVNRDLSVDDEDPIPGGQFNLTRPTVNEDTVPVILGGDPNYDYTDFNVNQQLADVLPTDDILAQGDETRSFVDDNYGKENPDIFVNDQRFNTPDYNQSMLYQDLISGPNPTTDLMRQNPNLSLSEINDLSGGLSGGASRGTPDFGYFADGGLTDNYGNMSTHEKLMRMASKMYG
jgi:hypothetical protein